MKQTNNKTARITLISFSMISDYFEFKKLSILVLVFAGKSE